MAQCCVESRRPEIQRGHVGVGASLGGFGFDHANTTVYQLISIPITSFNVGVTIVGGLKFTVVGSGAGITT